MKRQLQSFLMVCLAVASGTALADVPGLNGDALAELRAAGVDKYLGTAQSADSDYGVWTKHDFDPQYVPDASYPAGVRPDGPVCIAGSPYSVFSRQGDPKKLLIFQQGGGACWQNFYNCNVQAEAQFPPANGPFPGVFDPTMADNPFADYSVVYMPYCDGSTFGGDNDVNDPAWQAYLEGQLGLPPGAGPATRYHRGLRNVSAGMDVAATMFPRAKQITVMGHSAGGVGVAAFAPFLARFTFGNNTKLTVYNDAGPIAVNLGTSPQAGGPDIPWLSVFARQNDWQFQNFYPQSCVDEGLCNAFGQQTGIIHWRLANDSTIREAFYETDSDRTNRFFAQGDGTHMDPEVYRELILTEHGALNEAYPRRYKRFIVSGDDTHGGIQVTAPTPNFPFAQPFLFYTQEANGTPLTYWASEFVRIGQRQSQFGWKDIVEDYVPVAIP
ncbi:MAG: pectin acetylesterase-family hydrolase [Gammaproteobacteria bacterium]